MPSLNIFFNQTEYNNFLDIANASGCKGTEFGKKIIFNAIGFKVQDKTKARKVINEKCKNKYFKQEKGNEV